MTVVKTGQNCGKTKKQRVVYQDHRIFYSRVIASANVLPPEDPHDVLADAAPQSLLGQAGTLEVKVVPADRGRGQTVGVALDGLGVDSIA